MIASADTMQKMVMYLCFLGFVHQSQEKHLSPKLILNSQYTVWSFTQVEPKFLFQITTFVLINIF